MLAWRSSQPAVSAPFRLRPAAFRRMLVPYVTPPSVCLLAPVGLSSDWPQVSHLPFSHRRTDLRPQNTQPQIYVPTSESQPAIDVTWWRLPWSPQQSVICSKKKKKNILITAVICKKGAKHEPTFKRENKKLPSDQASGMKEWISLSVSLKLISWSLEEEVQLLIKWSFSYQVNSLLGQSSAWDCGTTGKTSNINKQIN